MRHVAKAGGSVSFSVSMGEVLALLPLSCDETNDKWVEKRRQGGCGRVFSQ